MYTVADLGGRSHASLRRLANRPSGMLRDTVTEVIKDTLS